MRKKLLTIIIISIALLTLTGCEDIMNVLPKFEASIPNVITGKYVYFANETDRSNNQYTELYSFNGKDKSFMLNLSDGVVKEGSFSYEYKSFAISEASGTLKLSFKDGEKKELSFYFKANSVNGPEYMLLDGVRYEYWGN